MNLADEGFKPICKPDSVAAIEWLLSGGKCEAILLDWFMPQLPGLAFLKKIREAGIAVPVIVFTGSRNDSHEDAALGGGAVDFVDKSRRFSVVLNRLRLALNGHKRASPPAEREEAKVGDLLLIRERFRAHWKGIEIALSMVEYRIVERLALQPDTDLSYREIYDVVHGEGFWAGDGEDGFRTNVRSLIRNIRQKFREIDGGFDAIENCIGYGYRWRSRERRQVPPETVEGFGAERMTA